ncbi:glycerol dehydrogenase [Lancefieldella parvula]|uniref:glycerol dehydrogenase n=1 Tax=Lancefieldella parvula TaxID=1382 RepID=UPI00290FF93B|nr:glycerol dehydrogenase [Lancefieldella parvula]MDU4868302.1 glycerol dehydrogenase [Lancefieldella parvula]
MKMLRAMREPLKYVQGKNACLEFEKEMGYMGKRFLFVCSNSGYKAAHDMIEQSFEGKDDYYRRYEIFGGISSNGEINRMKAIVEEDNIDVVVAIGGGSAVDTAKATAYYADKRTVILPTVAATDAPCTGLSVIYNDDGSFDKYLFYPQNPDAVMVDTQIIANAPVSFLVAGMGDALGTYFEGRASIRTESPSLEGTGITRVGMAIAKECYLTLRDYGSQAIKACENNVVTPALEAICEATVYMSGVGADNVNCAAAHSFYNGLTSLGGHSAPHGNCVAFGTLVQLVLEGVPQEEFDEVQDFCLEVGLPTTLEEIGITTDEQIKKIAEAACVPGETIHNLAGDVTPDELYAAIVQADAMGRALKA